MNQVLVLNYDQKLWTHYQIPLTPGNGGSLKSTFLLKAQGRLMMANLDFGTKILNFDNFSLISMPKWIHEDILKQSKYLSIIHLH